MLLIKGKLHTIFFFKALNSNKSKGHLLKATPHQRGQDKAVWQPSAEASKAYDMGLKLVQSPLDPPSYCRLHQAV